MFNRITNNIYSQIRSIDYRGTSRKLSEGNKPLSPPVENDRTYSRHLVTSTRRQDLLSTIGSIPSESVLGYSIKVLNRPEMKYISLRREVRTIDFTEENFNLSAFTWDKFLLKNRDCFQTIGNIFCHHLCLRFKPSFN